MYFIYNATQAFHSSSHIQINSQFQNVQIQHDKHGSSEDCWVCPFFVYIVRWSDLSGTLPDKKVVYQKGSFVRI